MKSIIILLLHVTIYYSIHAQKVDSSKNNSIDRVQLLSKSKLQRTVGWTIFGTGIPAAIFTGYLLVTMNKNDIDKPTLTKVFVASTVYTLLSIPLIIKGRLNKKRALSISLINNKVTRPYLNAFIVKMQPAISLHVLLN